MLLRSLARLLRGLLLRRRSRALQLLLLLVPCVMKALLIVRFPDDLSLLHRGHTQQVMHLHEQVDALCARRADGVALAVGIGDGTVLYVEAVRAETELLRECSGLVHQPVQQSQLDEEERLQQPLRFGRLPFRPQCVEDEVVGLIVPQGHSSCQWLKQAHWEALDAPAPSDREGAARDPHIAPGALLGQNAAMDDARVDERILGTAPHRSMHRHKSDTSNVLHFEQRACAISPACLHSIRSDGLERGRWARHTDLRLGTANSDDVKAFRGARQRHQLTALESERTRAAGGQWRRGGRTARAHRRSSCSRRQRCGTSVDRRCVELHGCRLIDVCAAGERVGVGTRRRASSQRSLHGHCLRNAPSSQQRCADHRLLTQLRRQFSPTAGRRSRHGGMGS